jgi:molybdenum cofactor cytidylyltransferase
VNQGDISSDRPTIGVIILAAGGSRRLGTPKQLVQFDGETLLHRIVREAVSSGCSPIVVVLGSGSDMLMNELSGFDIMIATNPLWERGIGSSIKCGLRSLIEGGSIDAAIISVCDQPFVTAEVIDRLASSFRRTSKAVVASGYKQTAGVPALFSKQMFPVLLEIDDSKGAKQIIYALHADIIPFPSGSCDIDTPADVVKLASSINETICTSTTRSVL